MPIFLANLLLTCMSNLAFPIEMFIKTNTKILNTVFALDIRNVDIKLMCF